MKRKQNLLALAVALVAMLSPALLRAQQHDAIPTPAAAPSEVPAGTRFLVGLKDKLSTHKDKAGKHFKAKTLEALSTPGGFVLPPGAEVRGHISRVEPAGLTGRARLWVSFDDIKTPGGRTPLIADVVEVPGEHSVKTGNSQEGEIEARTSKGTRDLEAAAAGAAIGAAVGGAKHGGKGAAIGAAIGGAGGFMVSSGFGQDLELQKGTKLDLELGRPLYLGR
jgi:hypothetical protein